MSNVVKIMLITLMIVYVLSPVDLCLGPIDDILVLLFGLGGSMMSKAKE